VDTQTDGKLAYSVEEAAKALSIGVCLCRELIRQKKLPAIRVGERRLILPKAALEKFLAEQIEEGAINDEGHE